MTTLSPFELQRRIEAVTAKRCPRKVEARKNMPPLHHPWKHLATRTTAHSIDIAFEVPIGYSVLDLRQETDAIFATCGAYIEISDRAGAAIVHIFPTDFPPLIPFEPSMLELTKGRSILIGFDRNQTPILHDFRVPHLLIAGMSGYGKTDLIRFILLQLIHHLTPEQLEIDIIDGKGFSFLPFRGIPHVRSIVRDIPSAAHVLKQAKQLMITRSDQVWKSGERDETKGFKWRIVLIDEAAQIAPRLQRDTELKKIASDADECASSIASVGREASVGLIYCTQRPDISVINPLVKANMEASFCFRTKTVSNSEIVIDRPGAEKLPVGKAGRGIYAATEDKIVQVPYVGNDEVWTELLNPYRKELPNDNETDFTGTLD